MSGHKLANPSDPELSRCAVDCPECKKKRRKELEEEMRKALHKISEGMSEMLIVVQHVLKEMP